MNSEYYTIANIPVKQSTLRIATHLLSLPSGAWPETQQAEAQLVDAIPDGLTMENLIEFAARHTEKIHASRMGWLRALGRNYTMADQARVYPALAK